MSESETIAATSGRTDLPAYDGSLIHEERYPALEPGAYGWDHVTATAAAYADALRERNSVYQDKIPDDRPEPRYLKYHSEWLDKADAIEAVNLLVRYRGFEAAHVERTIRQLPADSRIVFGRETSPVIYVWTRRPVSAYYAFDYMKCPPKELGGTPNAETLTIPYVGKHADDLQQGEPTLIRAWWD